jgi:hypothetical protein
MMLLDTRDNNIYSLGVENLTLLKRKKNLIAPPPDSGDDDFNKIELVLCLKTSM